MLKAVMKILLIILLIAAIIIAGYLIFMTVTDYRPDEKVQLDLFNRNENRIETNKLYTATTFNIGYAGLDKEQDFFMDGGKGSRASSKETVNTNLEAIKDFIKDKASDFYVLQEVDFYATRSFKINQYEYLTSHLPEYNGTKAINYKVPWVPVPILKPIGNVNSGIATLSTLAMDDATRYQFPGEEAWPRQLALLDRCFIESKYKLDNGKEFILINSHMSAYDAAGYIREQQVAYLEEYLTKQRELGNYVLVGGDWNHELPGTDALTLNTANKRQKPEWLKKMTAEFAGYKWGADPTKPTNRSNEKPFEKGQNFVAIIDGFLVSDNISITKVETTNLDFENSDHNPVTIEFKLLD